MKKIIKSTFVNILLLIIMNINIYSQDIGSLTIEQKKEYNRRKLTVELLSKADATGGATSFFGGGTIAALSAVSSSSWRAFEGLSSPLTAEEFFRVAGYNKEAEDLKKKNEYLNNKATLSLVLIFGGLIGSFIPVEEKQKKQFEWDSDYYETTFPFFISGTIAWIVGLSLAFGVIAEYSKQVAPFQVAAEIAEEYNKKIINELIISTSK